MPPAHSYLVPRPAPRLRGARRSRRARPSSRPAAAPWRVVLTTEDSVFCPDPKPVDPLPPRRPAARRRIRPPRRGGPRGSQRHEPGAAPRRGRAPPGVVTSLDLGPLLERRRTPLTTYRLQLHRGFGFAEAAAVADYLADLGITDCYTSPILKARPGSTHGYDICDHNALNPELGGEARATAASSRPSALRASGFCWISRPIIWARTRPRIPGGATFSKTVPLPGTPNSSTSTGTPRSRSSRTRSFSRSSPTSTERCSSAENSRLVLRARDAVAPRRFRPAKLADRPAAGAAGFEPRPWRSSRKERVEGRPRQRGVPQASSRLSKGFRRAPTSTPDGPTNAAARSRSRARVSRRSPPGRRAIATTCPRTPWPSSTDGRRILQLRRPPWSPGIPGLPLVVLENGFRRDQLPPLPSTSGSGGASDGARRRVRHDRTASCSSCWRRARRRDCASITRMGFTTLRGTSRSWKARIRATQLRRRLRPGRASSKLGSAPSSTRGEPRSSARISRACGRPAACRRRRENTCPGRGAGSALVRRRHQRLRLSQRRPPRSRRSPRRRGAARRLRELHRKTRLAGDGRLREQEDHHVRHDGQRAQRLVRSPESHFRGRPAHARLHAPKPSPRARRDRRLLSRLQDVRFDDARATAFDRDAIDHAVARARRRNPAMEPTIFDFIRSLMMPEQQPRLPTMQPAGLAAPVRGGNFN